MGGIVKRGWIVLKWLLLGVAVCAAWIWLDSLSVFDRAMALAPFFAGYMAWQFARWIEARHQQTIGRIADMLDSRHDKLHQRLDWTNTELERLRRRIEAREAERV